MFSFVSRVLPDRVTQSLVHSYFWFRGLSAGSGIHSTMSTVKLPGLTVRVLPALQDNYMYLIIDENTKEAAIVDPVDPDSVLKTVQEEGVTLNKVLTTHHHWDHAGGNKNLVKKMSEGVSVYGGDDRIEALTEMVKDGTQIRLGDLEVQCLATPCHTTGHICYVVQAPGQSPIVFTGDTLFIAGCGRFFEGTSEQMYSALYDKLGSLPDNTKVFCGHEYTTSNLRFAEYVEPENAKVKEKMSWAVNMRNQNKPTVPSTIGEEREYNPFMRLECLMGRCGTSDPVSTMGYIRKEKDKFK